jgi:hypothetical protein
MRTRLVSSASTLLSVSSAQSWPVPQLGQYFIGFLFVFLVLPAHAVFNPFLAVVTVISVAEIAIALISEADHASILMTL